MSSDDVGNGKKVRFSDFELDLASGELRKRGIRRKLAPQPFEVLALLLEQPGEVVSREAIQQRLWPDDTFVQFDLSLNAAVRKLRRTLGDSSDSPRFIETLPKRGYRFIAEVERWPAEAESVRHTTVPAPRARPRPVFGLAFALAVVAVAAGALVLQDRFSDPIEAGPYRFIGRTLDLPDGARDPALSPDGRSVAYVSREDGNSEIYVRAVEGGSPLRITEDPSADQNPVWSPDGSRLAFLRRWPGTGPGTYVASLLDGSKTLVMGQTYGASSWTPDGEALIASGGDAYLQRVNLETRKVEALSGESTEGYQRDAAVSPDGDAVAYARCVNPNSCDVYTSPLPSGPEKRLTFHYGRAMGIQWTPDGRELIYSMDGRLYRVSATGRLKPTILEFEPTELVGLGDSQSPSVARLASAGVTSLAFRHRRLDVDVWLTDLTADPEDSARRRKIIDSDGLDEWPGFSPNGKLVVFTSNRDGGPALWLCNDQGGEIRRLTPEGFRVKPGPPAWSPDGAAVAFAGATPEEGVQHIYRISIGEGPPRRVTFGKGESNPLWSRDGLWIYHQVREGTRPSLWKAAHDGSGPPVEVRSVPTWCYDESADGRFLYGCGSGDSPTPYGSLYRIPLSGGVPEQIASPFSFARIQFHDAGLYHVRRDSGDGGSRRTYLAKLDLDTGSVDKLREIESPWGPPHFSLGPDGERLLTTHMESLASDILLVEDFR